MNNLKIDFYGENLADYKKAQNILKNIDRINGCSNASFYKKKGVSLAGYSSIMVEWAIENKDFLLALAGFIYMLLKDKKGEWDKLILKDSLEITYKDSQRDIQMKLEKSISTF